MSDNLKNLVWGYMNAPRNEMDTYIHKVDGLRLQARLKIKQAKNDAERQRRERERRHIQSIYMRMKDGRRGGYGVKY